MTDPSGHLPFPRSEHPTVGIEREFNFVSFVTGEAMALAPQVLAEYRARHAGDALAIAKVEKEIHKITIEVISKIGDTVADAVADTEVTLAEVRDIARGFGAELLSVGIHPFVRWEDLAVSDLARMRQLETQHGIAQAQWISLGTHVHVGMPDPQQAILVDNITRAYLPHMLAMTTSSPYLRGRDTGVQSSREVMLRQIAVSGLMPKARDWEDYERMVAVATQADWIKILGDLHPLHRKSVHGTVEYRIPEAVPTAFEVGAVAAFAQCLAVAVLTGEITAPAPPDWFILNGVESARERGYEGNVFVDGRISTIRDSITDLMPRLKPIADHLGCSEELNNVMVVMNEWGSPAQRQRKLLASLTAGAEMVEYPNGERMLIDVRLRDLVRASVMETLSNAPVDLPKLQRVGLARGAQPGPVRALPVRGALG